MKKQDHLPMYGVGPVYGASLGAAVALELMAMPDLEVGTAIFDGCPLYKNAPFLKWMILKYYPKATLTVREGYGHCQYLSSMGEAYSDILEQYIHE